MLGAVPKSGREFLGLMISRSSPKGTEFISYLNNITKLKRRHVCLFNCENGYVVICGTVIVVQIPLSISPLR